MNEPGGNYGEPAAASTTETQPTIEHDGAQFDLLMVGSGLSSTFTLIRLLEALLDDPAGHRELSIAVVEKADQFYTGIAYGMRSGSTSLIITPLDEFLPPGEIEPFLDWMAERGDDELAAYRAFNGVRSAEWIGRVAPTISTKESSPFHVPRYLFGNYLTERLSSLADRAAALSIANLTLIPGEVIDLRRNDQLDVEIAAPTGDLSVTVRAKRAVLAIGMPPTKTLLGDDPLVASGSPNGLIIDRPYEPGLDAHLEHIGQALTATEAPHVVVLGANAGSLELLYQLANQPVINGLEPKITVISPQGRLPELFEALPNDASSFEATQLQSLTERDEVSAAEVLSAVRDDLARGRSADHGVSETLPPISSAVGALISKMSRPELESFVNYEGVEIGRAQRRAGIEYCSAAADLEAIGALSIVRGSFARLEQHDNGVVVGYVDPETGDERSVAEPATVVVNCAGPSPVGANSTAPLLQSIIGEQFCEATTSGGGFKVNDRMEAAPGVFVNGPLLAGNVIDGQPVWHVEHCGRIIKFSSILADLLLGEFTAGVDELMESAAQPRS